MYKHQHTKGQLNHYRGGTVISPDAHTHSPLTQTLFLPFKSMHFILVYLSVYLFLEGEQKFPTVYRHYFTHIYTSKCMQYPATRNNVFHTLQIIPATQCFLSCHHSYISLL